jgi:hypothetical protein
MIHSLSHLCILARQTCRTSQYHCWILWWRTHGVSYGDPTIVKKYIRYVQLSKFVELDHATLISDGTLYIVKKEDINLYKKMDIIFRW